LTAERIVDVAQAYEEDSTALSNLASFEAIVSLPVIVCNPVEPSNDLD